MCKCGHERSYHIAWSGTAPCAHAACDCNDYSDPNAPRAEDVAAVLQLHSFEDDEPTRILPARDFIGWEAMAEIVRGGRGK
jgi:hypothetical protein